MRHKWMLGAGITFMGIGLLTAVFGSGEEKPLRREWPSHTAMRQIRQDAMSNGWSRRNAWRRSYELPADRGESHWDGGIMRGHSRQGDNRMYANWHTETTMSSNGDAGYISLGDGTSYSWD
jgi:hypothetical protein